MYPSLSLISTIIFHRNVLDTCVCVCVCIYSNLLLINHHHHKSMIMLSDCNCRLKCVHEIELNLIYLLWLNQNVIIVKFKFMITMHERENLIREIAQYLRTIGDQIDQNEANSYTFQRLTILVCTSLYYYNLFFNCK